MHMQTVTLRPNVERFQHAENESSTSTYIATIRVHIILADIYS